jgi:hypothetical protein
MSMQEKQEAGPEYTRERFDCFSGMGQLTSGDFTGAILVSDCPLRTEAIGPFRTLDEITDVMDKARQDYIAKGAA